MYAVLANNSIALFGKSMHLREALYRGFLSVYGLLAPVYVWMFVVIKFGKSQQYVMNYRRWFVWSIAILLPLPFYIVGFFGDLKWIVCVLPLGVLLALLTPLKSITKLAFRLFFGAR